MSECVLYDVRSRKFWRNGVGWVASRDEATRFTEKDRPSLLDLPVFFPPSCILVSAPSALQRAQRSRLAHSEAAIRAYFGSFAAIRDIPRLMRDEDALGDMLVDILHRVRSLGFDPDKMIRGALANLEAEERELAGGRWEG